MRFLCKHCCEVFWRLRYFKFISCLCLNCLTFHSWLESCYNQFIDQGAESVFVSTGFRILLPFEVVFQHECHLCHLLNLIVSPWSGHVLEPSLIRVPSSESCFGLRQAVCALRLRCIVDSKFSRWRRRSRNFAGYMLYFSIDSFSRFHKLIFV